MRWVFFCLLILNVVYLVWNVVLTAMPDPATPAPSALLQDSRPLVLLSEAGVASQPGSAPDVSAAAPELCVTLGPWSGPGPAAAMLQELGRQQYRGEVRPVRVVRERLHWVYLPPYPDREQALRVLRELQNRQVDSFVVGDGADLNAISLGYFSSGESARGLMVKMRGAGYPAEVRETSREVTEYWIYFPESGVPDEGAALREALGRHPDLEGRNVGCANDGPAPAGPGG